MLDNDIYAKVIQLLAYLLVRHGIHHGSIVMFMANFCNHHLPIYKKQVSTTPSKSSQKLQQLKCYSVKLL